jgi:hypothetical protein
MVMPTADKEGKRDQLHHIKNRLETSPTQNTARVDQLPKDAAFWRISGRVRYVRQVWDYMVFQYRGYVPVGTRRYGEISILRRMKIPENLRYQKSYLEQKKDGYGQQIHFGHGSSFKLFSLIARDD